MPFLLCLCFHQYPQNYYFFNLNFYWDHCRSHEVVRNDTDLYTFHPVFLQKVTSCKNYDTGNSLAVQWLRLLFLMQGVQVWSLVRELRSHMLYRKLKQTTQKLPHRITTRILTVLQSADLIPISPCFTCVFVLLCVFRP